MGRSRISRNWNLYAPDGQHCKEPKNLASSNHNLCDYRTSGHLCVPFTDEWHPGFLRNGNLRTCGTDWGLHRLDERHRCRNEDRRHPIGLGWAFCNLLRASGNPVPTSQPAVYQAWLGKGGRLNPFLVDEKILTLFLRKSVTHVPKTCAPRRTTKAECLSSIDTLLLIIYPAFLSTRILLYALTPEQ